MALLDPYAGPWTEAEAAHLARRAGFGAKPSELTALAAAGMNAAVDGIIDYDPLDPAVEALIAALPDTGDLGNVKNPVSDVHIQGWWIWRMVHTTQPFLEQFTLFLHDHFVSERSKVISGVANNVNFGNDNSQAGQSCTVGTLPPDTLRRSRIATRLMMDQNHLLRRNGHRPLRGTLRSVTRDPAMLLYLDNAANFAGRPQENYAREIMELFSMGVDNYTEDDVREVARAFTGETINNRCAEDWPYTYEFNPLRHDANTKTVFGSAFNFPGAGADTNHVIDLILDRISNSGITPAHSIYPATSLYMAWKFLTWFVLETIPLDHPAVVELAVIFRAASAEADIYSVREALRVLFKSQFFYDPAHRENMYKHPADFLVTALRALGLEETGYSSAAPGALQGMGMRLFGPPNVAGWVHGTAWINSGNLIERFNYADRLSNGARANDAWVDGLIGNGYIASQTDNAGILEYFRAHLIQAALRPEDQTTLASFMAAIDAGAGSQTNKYRRKVRGMLHLAMTLPQYQLK